MPAEETMALKEIKYDLLLCMNFYIICDLFNDTVIVSCCVMLLLHMNKGWTVIYEP
jgi:hypothetical protein